MNEKKDPSKSPRDTNGPVVKTGPTAGQNRSRNDDGEWRKKRSDAGVPRDKKKGCFITAAVCEYRGLPDNCAELECLRDFRDTYMQSTSARRAMVAHYYTVAPGVASGMTPAQKQAAWESIEGAVAALRNGDPELALSLYRGMVSVLQELKRAV
jgi:hypothetical protein